MERVRTTPVPLVHVTTVPMTLRCLSGQPEFMRRAGFEVHVVSSPGEELQGFAEREGAIPHAVPMVRPIAPLRDLAALLGLWKLFRLIAPAIVDTHTPKAGLLGMLAAWLAGVPVRVYHMHGLAFMTRTGLSRLLLRWTETLAALAAHRVLCVSHSVREVAIAEGLCPAEKIRVLLGGSINGVDADGRFKPADPAVRVANRKEYGIGDNCRVIGFIGRLVREKGIVELVHAWRQLRSEFDDLHLLVVGPTEAEHPLSKDTELALQSDPRIHLVGLNWDTPPLYSAMDMVVLPTYREGFPVVPLEAASMGLPVVATRVPGCTDAVVDGVTGTLVPPRDSRSLAEAIRTYLRNPHLRHVHGDAARTHVIREFRQERLWGAMAAEYRSLLMMSPLSSPQPVDGGATAGSGS